MLILCQRLTVLNEGILFSINSYTYKERLNAINVCWKKEYINIREE